VGMALPCVCGGVIHWLDQESKYRCSFNACPERASRGDA